MTHHHHCSNSHNHSNRLNPNHTQAMIIDVQEKFAPHIDAMEDITTNIAILAQGLQVLDIPIMLNEQYPQGLGSTVHPISQVLNEANAKVFEKSEFSVCDCEPSWTHVQQLQRQTVIICGIEAHVCVQQTALDLLDNGMQPVIISDAISARNPNNKAVAIELMRQAGAIITTVEGILFELCKTSKHPAFKTISQLVT